MRSARLVAVACAVSIACSKADRSATSSDAPAIQAFEVSNRSSRNDDGGTVPRCPLVSARRAVELVSSFEGLAEVAPTGYPNWASIARDGAEAARVEDLDAVKSACRSCHQQYVERYRRDRSMGPR